METNTIFAVGTTFLGIAFLFLFRVLKTRTLLPKDQIMQLMQTGAIIIDVRTPQEFAMGHAPGSHNIPLDQLDARIPTLDPAKPTLVCCASGARSAAAKAILDRAGFAQVENAGPWKRLAH